MPYSERQQHIARLIAERGNLSTVEYLLRISPDQREVDGQQWQDLVNADPQRFHMFIPQWNQRNSWLLFAIQADTHMAVIDYLTVVRDLLARKLVTVLPDPKRHVRPAAIVSSINPPSVSERDQSALEIDALLQTTSELLNLAIYTERVYALPSLNDFISHNFQSTEERSLVTNSSSQQQQLRTLSRLSYATIAIATLFVIALIVALFLHCRHCGTHDSQCQYHHSESAPALSSQPSTLPRSVESAPLIVHDTLVIHDTVSTPKQNQKKKKKRRRYIDMSE